MIQKHILILHTFLFFVLGMTGKEIQSNVQSGYRLPQPKNCPPAVYEVLLLCWSENPEDRPNFTGLVDYFHESKHKPDDDSHYLTEIDLLKQNSKQKK